MKKNITYLLLVLLFASCEKYGDVELKEPFRSKLVVTTFIEGGSAEVEVGVTRTRPVYEKNNSPEDKGVVENADVRIRTPQNEYILAFDAITGTYGTTMSEVFSEGTAYTVIVSHNGETVHGTNSIPASVSAVSDIAFDSSGQFGQVVYNAGISVYIKDEGYRNVGLSAVMVYEDSSEIAMSTESFTNVVQRVKAGDLVTGRFSSFLNEENERPVRIDFKLMVCDDAYTRYNNMVRGGSWDVTGGPMTEPVIGYGNMSNGVGIIGSYRYVNTGSIMLK